LVERVAESTVCHVVEEEDGLLVGHHESDVAEDGLEQCSLVYGVGVFGQDAAHHLRALDVLQLLDQLPAELRHDPLHHVRPAVLHDQQHQLLEHDVLLDLSQVLCYPTHEGTLLLPLLLLLLSLDMTICPTRVIDVQIQVQFARNDDFVCVDYVLLAVEQLPVLALVQKQGG